MSAPVDGPRYGRDVTPPPSRREARAAAVCSVPDLLFGANVVLREMALARRAPQIDEITGCGPMRCGGIGSGRQHMAVAGLTRRRIEAIELRIERKALVEGLPHLRIARVELLVESADGVRPDNHDHRCDADERRKPAQPHSFSFPEKRHPGEWVRPRVYLIAIGSVCDESFAEMANSTLCHCNNYGN